IKKTMEILRSAIQMEIDGKEFYQQAGEKSSNKLARELFQRLASEEDDHRRKFEEIYEALKKGQDWPAVEPPSEEGKRLKSIFIEATKELGTEIKIAQSELEAIETAMNMELKTYDLYRSQSEQSISPLQKRFYQALAAEERGHHLALLDSYEYLTDPTGWFTVKEHWTLEGG
ncbi:MAG: ferritin family protein, partial [Dehalococcoidia bacterium]|nr:ferritin family protein [Dehalococcoidia bacterium]